ncbi:MAG TPA: hypothetical protein VGE21_11235 [Flavobacteriales bacterium]
MLSIALAGQGDHPMAPTPIEFHDTGIIDGLRKPVSMTEQTSLVPNIHRHFDDADIAYMKAQVAVVHSAFVPERFGRNTHISGSETLQPFDPHGYWLVASYPIFSRDSSIALVTIGHRCPGPCGSGENLLLVSGNRTWSKTVVNTWFH